MIISAVGEHNGVLGDLSVDRLACHMSACEFIRPVDVDGT